MSKHDSAAKMRVLLRHWIEHNLEHAAEFREWAEHAGEARQDLLSAADCLIEANGALEAGLKHLGGEFE